MPALAQHAAISRDEVSPSASNKKSKADREGQQTSTAGQKVQLREPTREEVEALIEGMKVYVNDSPAGLTPVQHPDGMISLDLQGRYQNITIAKIEADGSISTECVSSKHEAERFLTGKKKAEPKSPTAKPDAKQTVKPGLEEK
ncbi:MAG TPA: hypothetical protein VM056_05045 [Terriglobales bacterium]|nr:hypothetical protein [Terriglobales bacterium]